MRAIVLWLFSKIVPWIEQGLDPELKSRLDALNTKVAAVEAREREAQAQQIGSEKAYAESMRRREELDIKLAESKRMQAQLDRELRDSQRRQEEIRNEVSRLKADVDSRSDDDAIFSGVPKPGSGAGAATSRDQDPAKTR